VTTTGQTGGAVGLQLVRNLQQEYNPLSLDAWRTRYETS
jgi:hypothetical protein